MTDSVSKRVVKSIAQTIEEQADLPSHSLFRFREPRALLPDDCPALLVWLDQKPLDKVTTVRFDSNIVLGVAWYEATVEEAQTLIDDDGLSELLLDRGEEIERVIRLMATNLNLEFDGEIVSEAWEMLPTNLRYFRDDTGLTEGYRVDVVVSVSQE